MCGMVQTSSRTSKTIGGTIRYSNQPTIRALRIVESMFQVIGLREKIQENPKKHGKIGKSMVSSRFSLKSTHSMLAPTNGDMTIPQLTILKPSSCWPWHTHTQRNHAHWHNTSQLQYRYNSWFDRYERHRLLAVTTIPQSNIQLYCIPMIPAYWLSRTNNCLFSWFNPCCFR